MSFTPLDSGLYRPLFTSAPMQRLFSDEAHIARLVAVEAALARAQADLGLIPLDAAQAITDLSRCFVPDWERLQLGTAQDGFPVIALLAQLREQLPAAAAEALHFGATTQDIMDTALVLQLRDALHLIEGNVHVVVQLLAHLSDMHRRTLMAGRTHSQHALPITFGLKVAGWLAPLLRHLERLHQLRPRLLVVQCGGAAGTLAALGNDGLRVSAALARELGLGEAPLPWHTSRDTLAELGGWLSLLTGTLGKAAQDLILLAQSEVDEVRGGGGGGGSSTMPQKSNPIGSELIVAAARANAALLSGLHQAALQEHERGTHGWQLEWLTLPQMLGLTAGAVDRTVLLTQDLQVDAARMRANVQASGGLMMAEALTFALAAHVGQAEAKATVRRAVALARQDGQPLAEALRLCTNAPLDWAALHEDHYLGVNDALIDRLLGLADARHRRTP
ncbi:3-carboxy-cis,cis-muconate cycloisomerase [Deinococcus sp. QL22]|uniref:3-carboxy-cis,cis-muconate cycloisomerase n=1 Tax=Deinococcus sp. QL22 TaxID=2939437 RepID=UPI0020173287|nr:3-carboxy-cis,cis-muconate cycloisomerase [Deinococcus sp. QL22]UQN10248.1 3-carboxy-cis,cis-muconate cycloisomerase [Deinococcus sp. QL22]